MNIDLKERPFYLNDKQIEWVRSTISMMTLHEKIGQLFIDHSGGELDEDYIKERCHKTCAGGLRYINLEKEDMRRHNLLYKKYSKYPLLVASNIEAGGNGALKGGTKVGEEIKIAATGDSSYAYQMGYIGAVEAKAVGCNWAFAPIGDISMNWRNPIVSTRTWSDKADVVKEMTCECIRGIHDGGIAATVKHFPGDGVDERDHHFSFSVNSLSCDEWNDSFGEVYKAAINADVDAVMAGHIMLPSWQKELNPQMNEDDLMPASLSRELLTGLLREKLGFNGLIVTDATHMAGFSSRMSRKKALATAINAGCDMLLFFHVPDEDFMYMQEAVAEGILSVERIDEALLRIFAFKVKWACSDDQLPPLDIIGCERHLQIRKEVADKSITLAKHKEDDIMPISPEKHRRVMIMPVHTHEGEFFKLVSASLGAVSGARATAEKIKAKLNAEGFDAELFISPLASGTKSSQYEYKSSIEEFKNKYDLVLTVAECSSFNVTQRLSWDAPKGGFEIPWYVYDVPVIFISFASPFHLADVPQVKTMINCYDSQDVTIDCLIDKLLGRSEFRGISPVDVFCGLPDTRL